MRKITEQAVAAFLAGRKFYSGNTEVRVEGETAWLLLHGNRIAMRGPGLLLKISDAGWPTSTTKERLNGLPGVRVHHSKRVMYLNGVEWDGSWTAVMPS